MKNAMQLRDLSKKMAKEKNITAQSVLQNYMLERLLARISISNFKSNFVLKGGFLISAMLGIQTWSFPIKLWLPRQRSEKRQKF
jgi:predicted nucleotidyltransferase component of viral defense system